MRTETWLDRLGRRLRGFWQLICNIFEFSFAESPFGWIVAIILIIWGCISYFSWHWNTHEVYTKSYRVMQSHAAEFPDDLRPIILEALASDGMITGEEFDEIQFKYEELERDAVKAAIERCEEPTGGKDSDTD